MTFYAFLCAQAHRSDAIGRLVRDMLADRKQPTRQCRKPWRAVTYEGIRRHILREHCPDASFLDALDTAYAEYRATTGR